MKNTPKYFIVEAAALPEVFLKVAESKRLIATGQASTVNEATKMTGISRSAFYKYRDGVFPFYEATRAKIITLQISMDNVAGMLSNCINTIAKANANILTINQGIPIQNIAIATIAFDTAELSEDLEEIIARIEQQPGILHVEIVGQN